MMTSHEPAPALAGGNVTLQKTYSSSQKQIPRAVRIRRHLTGAALAVYMLLSFLPLYGQGIASVVGVVSDSSGAVVSSALVTINNEDTGLRQTATTDTDGRYNFPRLVIGNYGISVSAAGFKSISQTGINLTAEQALTVNFGLAVGQPSEHIQVSVIFAGGSWTTKHVAQDMPDQCRKAYGEFYRAPCLMANVAVKNWRFLYDLGLTEARWFEGFGNYLAIQKVPVFGSAPMDMNPDKPTVINLKILYSRPGLSLQDQVIEGRTEMLSTSYRDYERKIRTQLTMLFGRSGFEARRDVAGIILNRWGHAYLAPQRGFFFRRNGEPAPGETLRHSPYGRVAFANSDLSGIMDHCMSILEAQRAVKQVLAFSKKTA